MQRSKSVDRPRDHAGMASVAGVTGSHPPPAIHHSEHRTQSLDCNTHTHTRRLAFIHDNPTVWSELTWMVVTVILTHSHGSHCPVLKIKTLSSVLLQIPHRERKTRPRQEFRRQPGLCSRPPKRVIKWDEKQQHKVVVFFFTGAQCAKNKNAHKKKGWTRYKKSPPSNGNENAIKPLKAGVHDNEGRTFTTTAVMKETRKRKSIKLRSCQQEAAVKSCWVIKLKGFTVSWMYVCFFQWKDRGVLVFYCWRSLITLKSFQFTFRKPVLQHTVVIQPSVMSQTDLGRSDQTPSQVVTPPTHTAGFCVHLFPNLWKVKQQIVFWFPGNI